MPNFNPFQLVVLVLLVAIGCATFLTAIKAIPADVVSHMLAAIVGGALGAMTPDRLAFKTGQSLPPRPPPADCPLKGP